MLNVHIASDIGSDASVDGRVEDEVLTVLVWCSTAWMCSAAYLFMGKMEKCAMVQGATKLLVSYSSQFAWNLRIVGNTASYDVLAI